MKSGSFRPTETSMKAGASIGGRLSDGAGEKPLNRDSIGDLICSRCLMPLAYSDITHFEGRDVCPLCDYPIEGEEHDEDY